MGRHTMTGEVTSVAPDKGRLFIKTPEGRMLLHVPTTALQNVKKGDSVTVELALKDNGPAPTTKERSGRENLYGAVQVPAMRQEVQLAGRAA